MPFIITMSGLEKENKYSSKRLPTGDLFKPRNSYDFDSSRPLSYNLVTQSF